MSQFESSRFVKRRPRIVAMQKKLLVQLVENYFIRMNGHCSNVNFEAIDPFAYERFAEVLNTWGPGKAPREWKSSFYYMKNRIRRSVELIVQSNVSIKDNLSDSDFKLYSMSPSWFRGVLEETATYVDDNVLDAGVVEQEANGADFMGDFENFAGEQTVNPDDVEFDTVEIPYRPDEEFVLVAENEEELESYMNSSIILSDEEVVREPDCPVTVTDSQNDTETLEDCPEESYNNTHGLPTFNPNPQSVNNVRRLASKVYPANKAPKSKILNGNPAEKTVTNSKIPEMQKERLVQIVQNNFLKAFGRFTGANGAHAKARFWESTAKELNAMGPKRTAEQWKMTFGNIKTSAKAKLADDHNNVGGLVTKPLTRLEEKVLSIYGINALDGSQQLGEGGFRYKKTVPVASRACESTVTSGAFENLSSNIENQDVTVEASSDSNEPAINNDEAVLQELIREIREEPEARSVAVVSATGTLMHQRSVTQSTAARSVPVIGTNNRIHPEIRNQEPNSTASR